MGVGVGSALVPLFIADIAPSEHRGLFGSFVQMFVSIGVILVYTMGIGVVYSADFYKIVVYTGIGLACLQAILISVNPKPPRHLLWKNHQVEARRIF
jgi:SP family myo-inositol transporter-like MFS transporter 13